MEHLLWFSSLTCLSTTTCTPIYHTLSSGNLLNTTGNATCYKLDQHTCPLLPFLSKSEELIFNSVYHFTVPYCSSGIRCCTFSLYCRHILYLPPVHATVELLLVELSFECRTREIQSREGTVLACYLGAFLWGQKIVLVPLSGNQSLVKTHNSQFSELAIFSPVLLLLLWTVQWLLGPMSFVWIKKNGAPIKHGSSVVIGALAVISSPSWGNFISDWCMHLWDILPNCLSNIPRVV